MQLKGSTGAENKQNLGVIAPYFLLKGATGDSWSVSLWSGRATVPHSGKRGMPLARPRHHLTNVGKLQDNLPLEEGCKGRELTALAQL